MDVITAKEQIEVMHGWLWISGDNVLVCVCTYGHVLECVKMSVQPIQHHVGMLIPPH